MLRILFFILLLFFNLSNLSFADEFDEGDVIEDTVQSKEQSTDPLYYFNKGMFYTYKGAYKYGMKYVAIGYDWLPLYVKNRMLNFSINIKEPSNMVNHFLQLRINSGFESFFRFVINSTFGILGMWDVMGMLGMPAKSNDLGATLYFYGVPSGPYLVLFGPNNLRDSLGIVTNMFTEELYFPMYDVYSNFDIAYKGSDSLRVRSSTLITVVFFSDFYRKNESILSTSFDEYNFIKDLFIQNRNQELQKIATYN